VCPVIIKVKAYIHAYYYLVQHVVCGKTQRLFMNKEPLCQQSVQVMRTHHIVLSPANTNIQSYYSLTYKLLNKQNYCVD